MVEHALSVWGYGGGVASATIDGQQGGYRTRRLFPVAPSEADGAETIRPYAMPWTLAADLFGVAYPAGLVGVATQIALPHTLGATLNGDFEDEWEGGSLAIIPVPGVLPVGYTPSLQTDWRSLDAVLTRLRTAAGFTDQTWLPDTAWLGENDGPFILTGSGGTTGDPPGYMIWATDRVGFRKVQVKFRTGIQWLAMPTYDQVCTFSHNADGSSPGTSALGDTTDASLHVTDADFLDGDGDFWWETTWRDLGAIQASSIGTLTTFQIRTDSSASPFSLAGGVTIEYRLSPRCDVPYPISVAGQGDLIAPGGYP